MASKKPKVKTYDPSKYEADIQVKKQKLSQDINEAAMTTQKSALDESQKGIKDLYDSIGLFSAYMDRQTEAEDAMRQVYGHGTQGFLSLYDDAKGEAKNITDNLIAQYRNLGGFKDGNFG